MSHTDHQQVDGWRAALAEDALPDSVDDLTRELAALEALKCAAESRQARLALALDDRVRRDDLAAGIPPERAGRGVAEHVAFARRVSPHRGRLLLGLARSTREMPRTEAAHRAGQLSEWRTMILVRETACLELTDRQLIDRELADDPEKLAAMGDRELAGTARARAAELDAASVVRRRARAEADRCVTLRPAPDQMVYLTAPVAQGVATYAALKRAADTAVGTGAASNRQQVMVDTLVSRVTGVGDGLSMPVHPVALNLTMTDESLLAGHTRNGQQPAWLRGAGQIPAGIARALVADALTSDQQVTLRRLYTEPGTGELVRMESKARTFPQALAEFVQLRDQFCRTPYCDAPIRHIDHIEPHSDGGPTSAINAQGLCEQCNHAKQGRLPTPTSSPPPPLRRPPPRQVVVEIYRPMPVLEYVA